MYSIALLGCLEHSDLGFHKQTYKSLFNKLRHSGYANNLGFHSEFRKWEDCVTSIKEISTNTSDTTNLLIFITGHGGEGKYCYWWSCGVGVVVFGDWVLCHRA